MIIDYSGANFIDLLLLLRHHNLPIYYFIFI